MYGRDYFENGIGSNYVNYGDDPGWSDTVEALRTYLPRGSSVLEIGAAKGFFVRAARSGGYVCAGVDVSEYAVACSAGDVAVADASAGLLFADASFDAVVSWECLEHIPEDRIRRTAAEMDRVLRPGGVQVHRIAVFRPGFEAEFYSDATHVLAWSREEWVALWSGYERLIMLENSMDRKFAHRDWAGRFFAFRKPEVVRG